MFRVFVLAFVSSGLASPVSGGVLPVGSPGGFPTIQSAVDAASDGDIVLIASGSYDGFVVDGVGITVVADVGALVEIDDPVRVRNLSAGQQAALRGLTIGGFSFAEPETVALRVSNCLGSVRVIDCDVDGKNGLPLVGCSAPPEPDAWPAVRVKGCVDVAFVRVSLVGGGGADLFDFENCDGKPYVAGDAGDGIEVIDARVAIHDSTVRGGRGGHAWGVGGTGGDALSVVRRVRKTTT